MPSDTDTVRDGQTPDTVVREQDIIRRRVRHRPSSARYDDVTTADREPDAFDR